jgi:competence protein ComEC
MHKAAALLAASLILLSILAGCAMPWESPAAEGNATVKPAQPPQNPGQNTAPPNASNFTQQPQGNETYPPPEVAVPPENGSGELEFPLEPPLVPRSVSDKIYEGSFDVPDPIADPLKMHFIKAGFADSLLVSKGSFNMLVGDGNAEMVHPYLQSQSISRLDVVVATHDDPGAISGISDLIDSFEVGELWEGAPSKQSPEYVIMLSKARAKGVAIKHPEAGDRMSFGGLDFFVLNPPKGKGYNNNPQIDAVVLKVRNGDFCAVLLNPTVQEREPALISAAQNSNESLRCDVMTYFSHGEARSAPPSILEHVNPRDVVISVGPNTVGLPSPTTTRMLQDVQHRTVHTTEQATLVLVNYGFRAYDLS